MLRLTIAAAFKAKGKRSMSKSELTYFMSFDLKWFSHDKSKKVVDLAVERGLLIEEGDKLKPNFDISSIEIPVDFKPDLSLIEEKVQKTQISQSIFDEIVEEIAIKTGKQKKDVISEVNMEQEKLENLVDAEVAALIVAKKYGVDVSKYVEKVENIVKNQESYPSNK